MCKKSNNNTNNLFWHDSAVAAVERAEQKQQRPILLWFTGLSGSGKSTIANAVDRKLFLLNKFCYLLDGDNIRCGLNKDLGFDDASRKENIRRISEVAHLFLDSGTIVLSAFISPFTQDREYARSIIGTERFLEVFIDTPLDVCETRDPKGLYKQARMGKIKNFTGIDAVYEAPEHPHIHIQTDKKSVEECSSMVIDALYNLGYLDSTSRTGQTS